VDWRGHEVNVVSGGRASVVLHGARAPETRRVSCRRPGRRAASEADSRRAYFRPRPPLHHGWHRGGTPSTGIHGHRNRVPHKECRAAASEELSRQAFTDLL